MENIKMVALNDLELGQVNGGFAQEIVNGIVDELNENEDINMVLDGMDWIYEKAQKAETMFREYANEIADEIGSFF